jgi:hypothetical protein
METVAQSRARKAREDAERTAVRTKMDAEAMQGSKETLERLKKQEKTAKASK